MPNFIRDVEEIRLRAIRNLEDGAVTEAYQLDPDRSVAILNEALATEIVCVLRYMHHYFMATGVHAQAVRDEFKEHADAEREHADEIAERIQQLGGKPDFNPRTLLERSVAQYVEGETLGDMIREDLIAERIVIDVYSQMIRYFGDKDPTTRVLLEHILSEEEEHASDLSDLLYIVEPSTGETEGIDPGVHPLQMLGESRTQDQYQRGGRQQVQRNENKDRGQEIATRQNTEQFAGRGSANAGTTSTNTGRGGGNANRGETRNAQSEARPSRATGAGRPDSRNAQPEHEPGTTGRRRRDNEDATSIDRGDEGGMGGGTRAVRVTNKQRKNRAA
jgi:bacterioferritin